MGAKIGQFMHARRQTVDCSGLPCEGRFWERNWDQPKHTTCSGRPHSHNPTYSAFLSVFGVKWLRMQPLASLVGLGPTGRLAPPKNLPDSGVSSEAVWCYDAFFNATNEWSQWVPRKE